MPPLLDVIFGIAVGSGLSHIIFFHDDVKGDPKSSSVTYLDLPCEYFFKQWQAYEAYIQGNPPVINIVTYCDHVFQSNITYFESSSSNNLREAETSEDPLAHPMVNLMVIGSRSSLKKSTRIIGRGAMIKDAYRLALQQDRIGNQKNQVFRVESYDGRTVGSVNNTGQYDGERSLLSERFIGFDGRKFRVANSESVFFASSSGEGDNTSWSGFTVEIAEELSRRLNFTFNFLRPPDGTWGLRLDNGSWTGMIGMLISKKADMIVTSMTVTSFREEVVDFTHPYWEDHIAVAVTLPHSTTVLYIFKPLTWQVWLVSVSSLVITAVVLCFIHIWTRFEEKNHNCKYDRGFFLLATIRVLFGQGLNIPGKDSMRIVGGIVMMMMFVVYTTYSGNLIATLATSKASLPFDSLQGLTEDKHYDLVTTFGNLQHLVLKESRVGIFPRLYQRINSYPPYEDILKDLKANERPIAYIGDYGTVSLAFSAQGICNTYIIPEKFYPSGHAAALPENSPFLPYVSKLIIHFNDEGLLLKWRTKHQDLSPCSHMAIKDGPKAMPFSKVTGAFMALGIGICTSIVVLTLEIITSGCQCDKSLKFCTFKCRDKDQVKKAPV